eukprot:520294_1
MKYWFIVVTPNNLLFYGKEGVVVSGYVHDYNKDVPMDIITTLSLFYTLFHTKPSSWKCELCELENKSTRLECQGCFNPKAVEETINNCDIIETHEHNYVSDCLWPFSEYIEVEPYIDKTKEELEQAYKEHVAWEQDNDNSDIISSYDDWVQGYAYELDENGNSLTTYNPKSLFDYFVIDQEKLNRVTIKEHLIQI